MITNATIVKTLERCYAVRVDMPESCIVADFGNGNNDWWFMEWEVAFDYGEQNNDNSI